MKAAHATPWPCGWSLLLHPDCDVHAAQLAAVITVEIQGFSKSQAGMVQMLFNIGGALGSLLGGLLLDRCNKFKVVLFVYAGLLVALAGVGLSIGIVPMSIAGFAAGLFVMAAQLVLYALAPQSYPTAVRATGVGAAVAIGRLGSVAAPWPPGRSLPPEPAPAACYWQPHPGW